MPCLEQLPVIDKLCKYVNHLMLLLQLYKHRILRKRSMICQLFKKTHDGCTHS